jgi:hypothetical protein
VFRSIVAVNPNKQITTIFPSTGERLTLSDGDVACFDFNREIHRIEKVEYPDQPRRYCLKVHYVVYPAALEVYGRWLATITSWYRNSGG